MEVTIKELGEIITGNTPSKKTEEFWNSEDICFVKPDIISENGINEIFESNEYISEEAKKKARVVSKDSIFITCIGSIGKIGIALDGEYAFNQQINAIIPNDKILPKYLAYNLLYNRSRLISIANAPVVPIINKSQFSDFAINIDSNKNKQLEIVNVLDKLTYIIELRNDELSALDDLIKARFVELFGDPVYNTNDLPIRSLNELGSWASGGTPSRTVPEYFKGNIDWYSAGELNKLFLEGSVEKITEEAIEKSTTKLFKAGSLLIGMYDTAAFKMGILKEDSASNQACACITPNDEVNIIWLYYELQMMKNHFLSQRRGVRQKNLNLGMIKAFKIPIAKRDQQDEFSDFVKQVDKSKFQKYNATILSHNIYVFETRRRFICKPTLII